MSEAEGFLENSLEFSRFINSLQSAIDQSNRYIEENAPWKMAKEKNPELGNLLYNLVSNLKVITLYISPLMPRAANTIWEQIGETEPIESVAPIFFADKTAKTNLIYARPGAPAKKGNILFPRIK